MPSGKGKRLIVLYTGSAEGWVPGAELMFRSRQTVQTTMMK